MKKLILFLFGVFSLLFTGFGYCLSLPSANWLGNIEVVNDGVPRSVMRSDYITLSTTSQTLQVNDEYDFYCFILNNGYPTYSLPGLGTDRFYGGCDGEFCCFSPDETVNVKCGTDQNCSYKFYYYKFGYGPIIPEKLTSQQCQSEYGLISPSEVVVPIYFIEDENTQYGYSLGYNDSAWINLNGVSYNGSSVQGGYEFDLINQGGQCTGGVITGDNWSALYINDLQFPGKSSIFVNIPDYITWDYKSTDNDFTIDVGSGYDVDYINSIVDINSYRPDSTDFTNIFVSGLTLIFPYIIFTLFIVFLWKILKRIFK